MTEKAQGSMTTTEVYSQAHKTFAAAGDRAGIHAFQARLVLAIFERQEVTTPKQLAGELQSDGSQVRRWLPGLYAKGLVEGIGSDGGARRTGVATHVRLTADGQKLARWMLKQTTANGVAK